jgi:mono/diheme cytochrome c family protein
MGRAAMIDRFPKLAVAAGCAAVVSFFSGQALGVAATDAPLPTKDQLATSYQKEILPIFETYCYDCHGDGTKKGELSLDHFKNIDAMIADRDIWKRIRNHIDVRLMPPPDEEAPDDATRKKLVSWIDNAVFPVDPKNPDPGRVTLRRLNRTEYKNTIRDLLGVDVDVEEILPTDDSGYGFDNIGDVLTLSPIHLERYLDAARTALDQAVDLGPPKIPQVVVKGKNLKGDGTDLDQAAYFISNGEAACWLPLAAGRYQIHVRAGADAVSKEAAKMVLRVNGTDTRTWEVKNAKEQPATFDAEFRLSGVSGDQKAKIAIAFTNDFYEPENPDPKQRDRNLLVNQLIIEGPLDAPAAPSETHRRIYGEHLSTQTDDAYMLDVLNKFARRAFRRPAQEGEITRYLTFNRLAKQEGKPVEVAIRNALEAMLISPAFLFREEPGIGESTGGRQLISEHALASRLSYFLWSTMPDDQLFKLASAGQLRKNLTAEIARMIADPKAQAFTQNFAGQWLQLRNLSGVFPNGKQFPTFYSNKMASLMRTETEMLFTDTLKQNLPVSTLLTADYTFINDKLAEHYGIPDVKGSEFRKVSLRGSPRRGIFGQGSFLTMTSYPNRTSPVLRGQYILENILDTPAPPPPPNVPQLTQAGGENHSLSLREQMEKHRANPACASCHALMDPIGFGLQNFDAIGRWRDKENDLPINASGTLVTGQSFTGPEQLMSVISNDNREAFHHALAVKLLTYALGRGVDWYDRPAVDGIVMKADAQDGRFISMIEAVVTSVPFQYRRN